MKLLEFMKQFEPGPIYYKPNPGNGGDALIAAGAYQLFEATGVDYEVIQDVRGHDLSKKIVVYAGGGNFIDEYNDCAQFVAQYHSKVKQLILLPHTIKGHKALLQQLGENTTLFCREKRSYEYLESLELNCHFYMDHDLAFLLNPARYHPANAQIFLQSLKQKIKILLKGGRSLSELNAFRLDVEKTSVPIPPDNIDLSIRFNYDPNMLSAELIEANVVDIFQFLSFYKVINTNRLHIAIAGALLGKHVNLYPNSYWKNEAIYAYSLKEQYPNVCFHKSEVQESYKRSGQN